MDESKWFRWLRKTTRATSARSIALRVGVSHTTVLKWIAQGVPHHRVWELTIRFKGDPVAACVILGYVEPEDVSKFNYSAVVEYAPTCVLTAEIHKRAEQASRDPLHIHRQRLTAELEAM